MPVVIFVLVVAFTALLMKLAFALMISVAFVKSVSYIVRRPTCTPRDTKLGISVRNHKSSNLLDGF